MLRKYSNLRQKLMASMAFSVDFKCMLIFAVFVKLPQLIYQNYHILLVWMHIPALSTHDFIL